MLRDDQKLMKKEVDKLPKQIRKEEFRLQKDILDLRQQNQVCSLLRFIMKLYSCYNAANELFFMPPLICALVK